MERTMKKDARIHHPWCGRINRRSASDRDKRNILGMRSEDFPEMPNVAEKDSITISSELLKDMEAYMAQYCVF